MIRRSVGHLAVPADQHDKLLSELEGIHAKPRKGDPCEQYALIALESGWYLNLRTGTTYLNAGEIWKIGKTCLGEQDRYASGLPDKRLRFVSEFTGTAEQCLVVEKIKLYAYTLSPENQKRTLPLALPPGNKIWR